MNVKEFLHFVDNLIFAETNEHLTDLQKNIVQGLFNGQNYQEIANNFNYDEGYIEDTSRKLFKILSEQLGEDINKSNFSWTIERGINCQFNFGNNQINCYSSNNQPVSFYSTSKAAYRDLTLAPQIIHFYNRETELENLSNWIFNQNTRLISVLGLFGIGQTTLVKRFIDLNLEQFEVIIWRHLKFPKSLDFLLDDLLSICQKKPKDHTDDKFRQLLDLLTEKKCLFILDDLQNIFENGQLAGQYKPEYNNYRTLFKIITESQHQSHFILISQERCPEMNCLDEELYPIKCLELLEIKNNNILENKGLKDENKWLELINLYEGNIFYLWEIAILIKNIFDGKVAQFLIDNDLVITKNMQFHFKQLFNRLSPIEQQLILQLSKIDNPVSREDLRQHLDIYSSDLINGLQSLQERYLLQKVNEETILFNLSTVFKEYVRNCC